MAKSRIVLIVLLALAAGLPVRAETLRVAIPALPPSLGIPFTAVGQPSNVSWAALFDGLTQIDAKGQLQPALAISWNLVRPTTWRFTLRPDVRFHDGTALTAAAVAESLEVLRAPAGRKFYLSTELETISGLRVIDPLTLEIDTHRPDAILPRRLSIVWIVSPTAWKTKGEAGFAQAPVGTGSYRLLDWGKASGTAKFEAADSWRKPVAMDKLELVPLDNPISRLQALLSGRVDAVVRLNAEDIPQTQAAGFSVVSFAAPQVMSFGFRLVGAEKSPIADPKVRRALSMAINRPAMAEQILLGTVKPANQGVSAETNGFNPNLPPATYDPARAKALLAEAGYPSGFALTAEVVVGTIPADDIIYQQTVQDLSKVGVKMTLQTIPFATWLRKFTAGQWGKTDMFSLVWDSASSYDASRMMNVASCRKTPPFFCDKGLMPLYDTVDAELDEKKRLAGLHDLMAKMVDLTPALWLVTVSHHYALSPKIANVGVRNSGLIYEGITPKR